MHAANHGADLDPVVRGGSGGEFEQGDGSLCAVQFVDRERRTVRDID